MSEIRFSKKAVPVGYKDAELPGDAYEQVSLMPRETTQKVGAPLTHEMARQEVSLLEGPILATPFAGEAMLILEAVSAPWPAWKVQCLRGSLSVTVRAYGAGPNLTPSSLPMSNYEVYKADFQKFDTNSNGFLERHEVESLLKEQSGAEASPEVTLTIAFR